MSPPESTFERRVREHSRLAFRVAYAVVRNTADAEDAVQETFLKVFRNAREDIEDEPGWIARIAYRTALDLVAKRRHESIDEHEFDDGSEPHDHRLGREQQVERLKRLIEALPADLRH